LLIPLVHLTAAFVFGAAYFRAYLPAFALFLFLMDPIMLSQHVGVPLKHPDKSAGEPRPIRAAEQESLARTLVFPRWFARHVLLGFNYHSVHHARPTLPGHLLDAVPFEPTYSENWWIWLKTAKRTSLGELLKAQEP
jgi:fatty acid desaturase